VNIEYLFTRFPKLLFQFKKESTENSHLILNSLRRVITCQSINNLSSNHKLISKLQISFIPFFGTFVVQIMTLVDILDEQKNKSRRIYFWTF
jgi:hypothetical protein